MPRGLGAVLVRSCRAVLRVLGVSSCSSSACRRESLGGKTYAYPEGHPHRFTASKRVNPSGSVHRRWRCFGLNSFMSSSAGAVHLVKSGRDHSWDARVTSGVVSSRFLLSSRTPSRTWCRRSFDFIKARALVETWLILPVVICLSQRLSHACLSISFYMAKLRMAH